jgi:hypothetical protein
MKTPPRPFRAQQRFAGKQRLKPAAFVGNVGIDEILVAFRQVNNAFNQSDEAPHSARHQGDYDLDDPFLRVAEDKLVDAKTAKEDAADSGNNFLFRTGYFIAHKSCWVKTVPQQH